jgi:hypothetical protein
MRTLGIGLKSAVFVILCTMLITAAGSVLAAEIVDTGVVRNKLLIINDKSDHAVIVGERKFVIAGDTMIFNLHGKQIPLMDLAVPCEATVQYRIEMNKPPAVLRLQVKKPLPGATVSPLLHQREK